MFSTFFDLLLCFKRRYITDPLIKFWAVVYEDSLFYIFLIKLMSKDFENLWEVFSASVAWLKDLILKNC